MNYVLYTTLLTVNTLANIAFLLLVIGFAFQFEYFHTIDKKTKIYVLVASILIMCLIPANQHLQTLLDVPAITK